MFIRRTATRNCVTGESYHTFRLVRSERIGRQVRQVTLLNLGRHFALPQEQWPQLCARIEQLLSGQATLSASEYSEAIEAPAQHYAGRLLMNAPMIEPTDSAAGPQFHEVDVNSVEDRQPRSVGVEHVALAAMGQFGFAQKLEALGLNGTTRAAVIGNVIARMAKPGSELEMVAARKRPGGADRCRLRGDAAHPHVPRLGRSGQAPGSDRRSPVRPCAQPLRPRGNGHAV
jgi:hypothetical protein